MQQEHLLVLCNGGGPHSPVPLEARSFAQGFKNSSLCLWEMRVKVSGQHWSRPSGRERPAAQQVHRASVCAQGLRSQVHDRWVLPPCLVRSFCGQCLLASIPICGATCNSGILLMSLCHQGCLWQSHGPTWSRSASSVLRPQS